jgi:hypothetical protein
MAFFRRTTTLRLRAERAARWRSRSSTVIHESPHGRPRFSAPTLELDLPLDEGVVDAREVSDVDKSSLVGLSAVILLMVGLSDRWDLRQDGSTNVCGAGVANSKLVMRTGVVVVVSSEEPAAKRYRRPEQSRQAQWWGRMGRMEAATGVGEWKAPKGRRME